MHVVSVLPSEGHSFAVRRLLRALTHVDLWLSSMVKIHLVPNPMLLAVVSHCSATSHVRLLSRSSSTSDVGALSVRAVAVRTEIAERVFHVLHLGGVHARTFATIRPSPGFLLVSGGTQRLLASYLLPGLASWLAPDIHHVVYLRARFSPGEGGRVFSVAFGGMVWPRAAQVGSTLIMHIGLLKDA